MNPLPEIPRYHLSGPVVNPRLDPLFLDYLESFLSRGHPKSLNINEDFVK